MSRKDTYRQKVYDAEKRWIRNWGSHGTLPIEEGKRLLDHLAEHFKVPPVSLRHPHRRATRW